MCPRKLLLREQVFSDHSFAQWDKQCVCDTLLTRGIADHLITQQHCRSPALGHGWSW